MRLVGSLMESSKAICWRSIDLVMRITTFDTSLAELFGFFMAFLRVLEQHLIFILQVFTFTWKNSFKIAQVAHLVLVSNLHVLVFYLLLLELG